MCVPGGPRGVVPFVALERAGVVHQHADRPERRDGLRQHPDDVGFLGQIGLQHDAAHTSAGYLGAGGLGFRDTRAAMQRDGEAGVGEGEGDRATDPLSAAGNQGSARDSGGNAGFRRHGVDRLWPRAVAQSSSSTQDLRRIAGSKPLRQVVGHG